MGGGGGGRLVVGGAFRSASLFFFNYLFSYLLYLFIYLFTRLPPPGWGMCGISRGRIAHVGPFPGFKVREARAAGM